MLTFLWLFIFFSTLETSFIVHVDYRNKMWPYYGIVPYSAQQWDSNINMKWPVYLAHFVRVALMLKIIYLTQKAYFSPQMQYLKFLFIINRVSHENIPGLLQESQITCASEEFWENSAEKVYFLSCNKRNKALFPAFFIYFL